MMNFDDAAQRLARDQQKIRGRKPIVVSDKAKKQAEFQRKQRAKMQAERERERRLEEYQKQYIRNCETSLHVKNLGVSSGPLMLQPTSIYGTGDKISLPPSVLETLTGEMGDSSQGNPWTFRIGIINENYQFPASPLIHTLKPPVELNGGDDDDMLDSDDDEADGEGRLAYLDEMAHKYISYTHCTVVEFTQEEGHVGIPQHIATSLLDPKNRLAEFASNTIPVTRTMDPAEPAGDSSAMEVKDNEDPSTATPGHVAHGAFDIPHLPLEIVLVKLPKGKGCTLVPTKEAVRRGFYGLKDVKLVLEQSLIRTRATISKGDVVSTWHRGIQFDLDVTSVIPAAFGAVTCINTDIEVEIGETENEAVSEKESPTTPSTTGHTLGTGRTLASSASPPSANPAAAPSLSPSATANTPAKTIIPEPPSDQIENVVNVQIRFSDGSGKRRFDVTKATVHDLLEFASSILSHDISSFRLVTRFPRRVFALGSATSTLADAGINAGQELFLVESV